MLNGRHPHQPQRWGLAVSRRKRNGSGVGLAGSEGLCDMIVENYYVNHENERKRY